jgi:hypothetical protein
VLGEWRIPAGCPQNVVQGRIAYVFVSPLTPPSRTIAASTHGVRADSQRDLEANPFHL